MKQTAKLAACLIAVFCTITATAQLPSTQDGAASQPATSPAAYVYVTTNPSGNISQLNGYSAAADGTLTPLAGSPFWTTTRNLRYGAMAVTGHWLFVSDGVYIYSFSIASSGALKRVSSINAEQHYGFSGFAGASLVLDHTGSTVYALAEDGVGDDEFQFFTKNSTSGALTYFGSTGVNAGYGGLAFTGNNRYAYGASCIQLSRDFYGFSRGSDGTLTRLSIDPLLPNNNYSDEYCPLGAAADPANNLAIPVLRNGQPPLQLSVYTADNSGNLTTKSTTQNMPYTAVGWLHDIEASPAGNLLSVAGASGLQVFHFNRSNPITPYTGLLATHEITQTRWDTHNHLYGISPSGQRLYSFTVTASGHKQAAGSPYPITNPRAISVLSK